MFSLIAMTLSSIQSFSSYGFAKHKSATVSQIFFDSVKFSDNTLLMV